MMVSTLHERIRGRMTVRDLIIIVHISTGVRVRLIRSLRIDHRIHNHRIMFWVCTFVVALVAYRELVTK